MYLSQFGLTFRVHWGFSFHHHSLNYFCVKTKMHTGFIIQIWTWHTYSISGFIRDDFRCVCVYGWPCMSWLSPLGSFSLSFGGASLLDLCLPPAPRLFLATGCSSSSVLIWPVLWPNRFWLSASPPSRPSKGNELTLGQIMQDQDIGYTLA